MFGSNRRSATTKRSGRRQSQQPKARSLGRKAATPAPSGRRSPKFLMVGTVLAAGTAAATPAGRRALAKVKDRAMTARAHRSGSDAAAETSDLGAGI